MVLQDFFPPEEKILVPETEPEVLPVVGPPTVLYSPPPPYIAPKIPGPLPDPNPFLVSKPVLVQDPPGYVQTAGSLPGAFQSGGYVRPPDALPNPTLIARNEVVSTPIGAADFIQTLSSEAEAKTSEQAFAAEIERTTKTYEGPTPWQDLDPDLPIHRRLEQAGFFFSDRLASGGYRARNIPVSYREELDTAGPTGVIQAQAGPSLKDAVVHDLRSSAAFQFFRRNALGATPEGTLPPVARDTVLTSEMDAVEQLNKQTARTDIFGPLRFLLRNIPGSQV
jgi:hypothetical protein